MSDDIKEYHTLSKFATTHPNIFPPPVLHSTAFLDGEDKDQGNGEDKDQDQPEGNGEDKGKGQGNGEDKGKGQRRGQDQGKGQGPAQPPKYPTPDAVLATGQRIRLPGEPDPAGDYNNWLAWMAECFAGCAKYSPNTKR